MSNAAQQSVTVWPLVLFAAGAIGLVTLMIGLSSILGGRHNEKLGNEPYESGIRPTGSANQRLSVQFYLVAIIFVLFDLEVVFVFSYAIAAPSLGWAGYGAFIFFLGLITLGLVYEWRIGALNWAPRAPRQHRLAAIEANRAQNLGSSNDTSTDRDDRHTVGTS